MRNKKRMFLHELPTKRLRQALRENERTVGSDAASTRILRRELARRRKSRALQRHPGGLHGGGLPIRDRRDLGGRP
jgi:hypothetical protein